MCVGQLHSQVLSKESCVRWVKHSQNVMFTCTRIVEISGVALQLHSQHASNDSGPSTYDQAKAVFFVFIQVTGKHPRKQESCYNTCQSEETVKSHSNG